jgi:TPR repeat protein
MAAALADGASPDDDARMRIGSALLTGVGAPRSIEDGAKLMVPLARTWNGKAAAMLADAFESVGRDEEAYEMALIALASGELSALGTADALEARMPLDKVLAMQDSSGDNWPGGAQFEETFKAAITAGDVSQIRKLANATSVGRGLPRSYKAAYMLATLASAGGDRGAANLRDRMDRRFGGETHWQTAASEAAAVALTVWTEGGMGAAIAGRAQ